MHLDYWLDHSLPVILICHIPKHNQSYWLHIRENNITRTKKGWKALIPKTNITIALFGLEKDGFIKCEDFYGDSSLGYISELNGTEITIKIDQNTARELDAFLGSCSEEFINYLKKEREEESQTRPVAYHQGSPEFGLLHLPLNRPFH